MTISIPESLFKARKKNLLIPLVGAGVSMAIKRRDGDKMFPSWRELLALAAKKLQAEHKQELASAINAMLPIGRYKAAADFAREGLSGTLWSDFFHEIFAIKRDEIDPSSMELSSAIWEISNRIVTLNYDKVLKFASPSADDVVELDNSNRAELASFGRNSEDAVVWHLHGRIDNISQIVFTSESYDDLYLEKDPSQRASLVAFRSLCREQNLLFIGCSLDDAELLAQLAEQQQLFDGNVGPHFVITREDLAGEIKNKLKNLPIIEVLTVPEFGAPLIEFVRAINRATNTPLPPVIAQAAQPTTSQEPKLQNVAVLAATPLNKDWDFEPLYREVKKLKSRVVSFCLNEQTLNELYGFDYIFILSRMIKGRIAIEDQYLATRLISINELEDFIGDTAVRGVFVLVSTDDNNFEGPTLTSLGLPIAIIPNTTAQQISSALFQIFRKANLRYLPGTVVLNEGKFDLKALDGPNIEERKQTKLPETIDVRTTNKFVGRRTDLEVICKKILDLRDTSNILTIKGSGGIGKTITAKKVIVELAKRNYFQEGIGFIDCESITDAQTLESKIALNFHITNHTEIREQIRTTERKHDSLILLDNVETLLHLSEAPRILEFIDFVAGYSNIVVTSRELLRLEAEEIYELRQLTTDEGLSLFEQNYGGNLTNDAERLFVRSEIIEKLLDNNPLAIKLITSNIPKGKSFVALKHELEEDFFCKVSDAELATYDSLPDTNIERKKSLYASIDFSYRHLDEKEKKAFELLSLFPDGINIENLKRISNGKGLRRESKGQEQRKVDDFKITDPIIKALENKSMIQVDNNLLKLQSIVGKFSEKKLSDRKPAEIKRVQRAALVYNFEFCAALNSMYDTQHSRASRILHEHQNNFMKSFEFVDAPGFSKADLLVYMSDLNVLFNGISANGAFARAMARQSAFFSSEEDANLCFKSILLNSRYFDGQFDAAFDELRRILPLDQLKGLDFSKSTLYIAAGKAGELYSMEGFALDIMEVDLARGFRSPNYYPGLLFAIGEFSEKLAEKCYPNFFKFASLDAMGILSLEKLDEYMFGIYEKTHIERMQTHYLRCKHRPIAREVLEELVVVNPYTDGLKLLMRAFLEENEEQKTPYIVQAIEKLVHIKYFYVDALYYYAQNLKALGKTCEYKDVLERGKAIARDCGYRYLLYRFDILTGAKTGSYCVEEYALSEQVNLDAYLISLINTK